MPKPIPSSPASVCMSAMLVVALGLTATAVFQPQFSRMLQTFQAPPAMAEVPVTSGTKVINGDLIRVGISDDSMQQYEYGMTQISSPHPFEVTEKNNGGKVYQAQAHDVLTVTASKDGLWVKPQRKKEPFGPFTGPVSIVPNRESGVLSISNITRKGVVPSYRGSLEILKGYSSPNRLTVVNVLPMQDYLKAVVPNELPSRYGYEAVKAQAVAARNYAIRPREKPWPQFDICDSQLCQAYYGAQTETEDTTRALEETEGLIALYDGEPILALYSSSHGGVGERYAYAFSDPKTNKFPGTDIPYLKGGPDVSDVAAFGDLRSENGARQLWTNPKVKSYDVLSPHYRWEKNWSAPELASVLNRTLGEISSDKSTAPFITPLFQPGSSIGTLKRLTVKERGVSGKAMALEIEGSNGTWLLKKEFVIRKALSNKGRMLPSANIVVSHQTQPDGALSGVKVSGGGFGHGVGMSQLGASWMSKNGYRFPQILQHYYQGVSIGSVPVTLGPGHYTQPVKTTFFAKNNAGFLWIETDKPDAPVRIRLNGESLTIRPEDLEPSGDGTARLRKNLSGLLLPNHENSLVVYPDKGRTLKAWVEVYAPKETMASLSQGQKN